MEINLEKLICITQAAALGDACFDYILGEIRLGISELQIARKIDEYLLSHGGTSLAFPTICVAGENGCQPHGVPSDYRIAKGDLVTIDFGAVVGGYCGDMTRTVAVGRPYAELRELYYTVLDAQLAAIDVLAAGVSCQSVDTAAREIIEAAGFGEYYIHGTGHGVGKEVHEAPTLNAKSEETLQVGMAVTVEPGIYIPGKGGVRIEDLFVITETGIINLVKSDKSLIIL
ncbi:MAG: aminopeptidase P family protein [Clostridiales Family XIII bacterium]|jgi:Xaa-Pro aminopeptidase|nr:aminopeptidase P family protein [Clostridiales Family XIII bacterium]